MKAILTILLFFPLFLSAQPINDSACDPQMLSSCTLVSGTTIDATVEIDFSTTGSCPTDETVGVFYNFKPDYPEPYLNLELTEIIGAEEITILFGTWLTDCDSLFQTLGEYCGPINDAQISVMGIDSSTNYAIYIGTSSDQQATFSISACQGALPTCVENDICDNAIDMGILEYNYSQCITGCNTGVVDEEVLGDCEHEGVVWYKVATTDYGGYLVVEVTSNNNIIPVYQVFNGTCNNLIPISQCRQGNINGPAILIAESNTEYFIGISSFFVDSPEFELCVSTYNSGSKCVLEMGIEPVSTSMGSPLSGPYEACEQVQFCATISEYSAFGNGCQWLQGVIPIFGNGWDSGSFDTQGKPLIINQELTTLYSGIWGWYTDVTYNTNGVFTKSVGDFDNDGRLEMCHNSEIDCSNNGINQGDIMPGGWYAATQSQSSPPHHPNEEWGDGLGCNVITNEWKVCFTLNATCDNDCEESDCLDASVKIYTTSDGETGSWNGGISTCSLDEPAIFKSSIIETPGSINEITYESGENYTKLTNQSAMFDHIAWQLQGEEIFKTDANEVFLIVSENGEQIVNLHSNSGFNITTLDEPIVTTYYPVPAFSTSNYSSCTNEVIILENSTEDPLISSYWSIPEAEILNQTDSTIEIQFQNADNYDVILSVTDIAGNQTIDTFENALSINNHTTSNFNHDINQNILSLNNTSESSDSILWIFNNLPISNIDPELEIMSNGIYEVTLISWNSCSTDTLTKLIDINIYPEAKISIEPLEKCPGIAINFNNETTQNLDSLRWHFPGASINTSTEISPSVVYETAGTFISILNVYNPLGQSSDTLEFEVLDSTEAVFTYQLLGNKLILDNQSTNYKEINWRISEIPDTIESQNPTIEFNQNGNYEIELIASNQCNQDSLVETIFIDVIPEIKVHQSIIAPCSDEKVLCTIESSQDLDLIAWSFPEGEPQQSNNDSVWVSFSSEGLYLAKVIASNSFGMDSIFFNISVSNEPTSDFEYMTDYGVLELTNTSIGFNSFHWLISGIPDTISSINPIIHLVQNDVYEVILITENNCNADTLSKLVDIDGFPEIEISTSMASGCNPFEVLFIDSTSQNTNSRIWNFEGGFPFTSESDSVLVTYSEAGKFDVSLFVTNEFGSDSLKLIEEIEVFESPMSEFTYQPETGQFINNSEFANSYLWDFGDDNSSDEINPIHFYESNGIYKVILSSMNDNCINIKEQTLNITTVKTENPNYSLIDLYPNPVRNELILTPNDLPKGFFNVNIIDLTGKSIKLLPWNNSNSSKKIINHDFDLGMYYLIIENEDLILTYKFIVI